jgi:REP element-mobilizing transposase RayT
MANTYTSLWYHLVFSTKNRVPCLTEGIRDRLWPYIGGIAREHRLKALAVGGVADHAHVLVAIPAAIAVAQATQIIKGGSSHWVNENFRLGRRFSWQDGYGAFTVSRSALAAVQDYIHRQPEHHRRISFEDEYRKFLTEHKIDYDDRHAWG